MRGICRKAIDGATSHVRVQADNGDVSWMTVEEYSNQDIDPPAHSLPECPDDA